MNKVISVNLIKNNRKRLFLESTNTHFDWQNLKETSIERARYIFSNDILPKELDLVSEKLVKKSNEKLNIALVVGNSHINTLLRFINSSVVDVVLLLDVDRFVIELARKSFLTLRKCETKKEYLEEMFSQKETLEKIDSMNTRRIKLEESLAFDMILNQKYHFLISESRYQDARKKALATDVGFMALNLFDTKQVTRFSDLLHQINASIVFLNVTNLWSWTILESELNTPLKNRMTKEFQLNMAKKFTENLKMLEGSKDACILFSENTDKIFTLDLPFSGKFNTRTPQCFLAYGIDEYIHKATELRLKFLDFYLKREIILSKL